MAAGSVAAAEHVTDARMDTMRELLDRPGTHDMSGDFAPKSMKLTRILRTRIQRGDFQNGDVFDRKNLAAEYGVCPSTVTGALSTLTHNGYAEFIEGSRFRVTYRERSVLTVPPGATGHETDNRRSKSRK